MTIGSTPAARVETRVSVWLSYGILLAGLGAAMASAYIVISTYSPLPHWDEWALFDHLATGNGWSWAWLWAQHNEHRILIPKVFFLLDVRLFRGTQAFLLASIFLIQLLQAALLSFSLWTLGGVRGSAWRTGSGLIAYCILCPTQQENLIWGFQLQFVLPAAMATLAVLSLLLLYRNSAERNQPDNTWLLLLTVAAATVATWSLANGMLLWPLLLLTALLLRMKSSTSLIVVVCGAANIGLYFYRYHRPSPQSAVPSAQALGSILRYVAVYFGSTWVRHSSGWVAVVAGAAGICAGLLVIAHAFLQRRTRSLFLLELCMLMLLPIATAAITAWGRWHLGLEQATASRYQTFALLFWCCLGLALVLYASKRPTQWDIISAFLLAVMLGFATQVRLPLIDAQWHQLRLRLVSLALLTGVHDPVILAEAYPDPQAVLRAADYMKQNRLSIFAGDLYSQLGRSVDAVYRLRPGGGCSGYVSGLQVVPAANGQGLRIAGYAWDNELHRPARAIVAVVDGRISGFGSTIAIPQGSGAAGQRADAARFGWIALVGDLHPASKVDLYAVVGNHHADVCPFATASL